MATTITVNNISEFENLIDSQDIALSDAFVSVILKNIDSKKRHHHALSVVCLDENEIYDITVDRKDFLIGLKENLKVFESVERYEDCLKIKTAIEMLENQTPTKKRLASQK
jgi:hypothetical protein